MVATRGSGRISSVSEVTPPTDESSSSSRDDEARASLQRDIEIVRAYGMSHEESWVDVHIEQGPPLRIVATFRSDRVDEHADALARLVESPDHLDVRATSGFARAHLDGIAAAVRQVAERSERGAFRRWGIREGHLDIALRADQCALAHQLVDTYGDAVRVSVGCLRYPECAVIDRGDAVASGDARGTPSPLAVIDGEVRVDGALVVASGHDVVGTLLVHNAGSEPIVVVTNGVVTARVVDPVSGHVVGVYSGAQTAPRVTFLAPPGEFVAVPVLVGTASVVPALGYAVPPGLWAITAEIEIEGRGRFETPRLPLTVTTKHTSVSSSLDASPR